MKVPLSWLSEFIDIKGDLSAVTEALQRGGFNVADVRDSGPDKVIDIELPSNRPDCLGIFGMARELAFLTGWELKEDIWNAGLPPASDPAKPQITIEDGRLCGRYIGVIIRGVTVLQSPELIRQRLSLAGIKAINNIVDATNYIMYETGQPLHAFDLDKLDGQCIIVRRAKEDESIVALDDKTYKLAANDLVIADSKKPVAIAGIMGGRNSSITAATKNILIESAWFDPISVRMSARRLGLSTDSSIRFEHIAIYENVRVGAARVVHKISELSPGCKVESYNDIGQGTFPRTPVLFSVSKANETLGTSFKVMEVKQILARGGIVAGSETGDTITLTVPQHRIDLKTHQDIEEELVRRVGLGSIHSDCVTPVSSAARNRYHTFRGNVRELLLRFGYQEVLTPSFTDPSYADLFRHNSDGYVEAQSAQRISGYLRNSMIPEMLNVYRRNAAIKEELVNIFEISKVYIPAKEGRPVEKEHVCILNVAGYPDINAFLSELGRLLDSGIETEECPLDFAVRTVAFRLKIGAETAGYSGRISALVCEKFDVANKVFFAEIDLGVLSARAKERPSKPVFSAQPSVERDIAVIVDDVVKWDEISSIVRAKCAGLLHTTYLFDTFKGGNIPAGRKSVAFRIVFYPEGSAVDADRIVAEIKRDLAGKLRAVER